MKTECAHTLRVLDILHENLNHASPTAVHTEDISLKLKLSRTYLKEILLRMHQAGDILCAHDVNCSIITQQGVKNYLKSSSLSAG